MPNAKRPSGPGRPTVERRDAAHEREELEDLEIDDTPAAEAEHDPTRGPRTAERDAYTKHDNAGGGRGGNS